MRDGTGSIPLLDGTKHVVHVVGFVCRLSVDAKGLSRAAKLGIAQRTSVVMAVAALGAVDNHPARILAAFALSLEADAFLVPVHAGSDSFTRLTLTVSKLWRSDFHFCRQGEGQHRSICGIFTSSVRTSSADVSSR